MFRADKAYKLIKEYHVCVLTSSCNFAKSNIDHNCEKTKIL